MVHPYLSKILGQLTWTRFRWGCLKPFPPPFVKKTNSCRISRKSVRSDLQVHDICSWFFGKIIIRFTICYFIIDPLQVLRGSVRSYEYSIPSFWAWIEKHWKRIKNSKMTQTMWILRVLSYYVTYLQVKIPNLEYYQYIKNPSREWPSMFEVLWLLGQTTNVMAIIDA